MNCFEWSILGKLITHKVWGSVLTLSYWRLPSDFLSKQNEHNFHPETQNFLYILEIPNGIENLSLCDSITDPHCYPPLAFFKTFRGWATFTTISIEYRWPCNGSTWNYFNSDSKDLLCIQHKQSFRCWSSPGLLVCDSTFLSFSVLGRENRPRCSAQCCQIRTCIMVSVSNVLMSTNLWGTVSHGVSSLNDNTSGAQRFKFASVYMFTTDNSPST